MGALLPLLPWFSITVGFFVQEHSLQSYRQFFQLLGEEIYARIIEAETATRLIFLLNHATSFPNRACPLFPLGVFFPIVRISLKMRTTSLGSGNETSVPVGYALLKMRQPYEPGKRYRAKASPCFFRNLHTLVFSQPHRCPRVSKVKLAPYFPYWITGAKKENPLSGSSHTV